METIGDKWCYLQGGLLTACADLALGMQGQSVNNLLKFLQSLPVSAPSAGPSRPPSQLILYLQLIEKYELK